MKKADSATPQMLKCVSSSAVRFTAPQSYLPSGIKSVGPITRDQGPVNCEETEGLFGGRLL